MTILLLLWNTLFAGNIIMIFISHIKKNCHNKFSKNVWMVHIIACNGMSQGEPQRLKSTLEEINTHLHFFLFLKVKYLCFQHSSQIFSILSLILKGKYFPVLHKLGLWYLLYLICSLNYPLLSMRWFLWKIGRNVSCTWKGNCWAVR